MSSDKSLEISYVNMKIRANDIVIKDAKRFDRFSNVIVNSKNKILLKLLKKMLSIQS